jgi:hypothetical protein
VLHQQPENFTVLQWLPGFNLLSVMGEHTRLLRGCMTSGRGMTSANRLNALVSFPVCHRLGLEVRPEL